MSGKQRFASVDNLIEYRNTYTVKTTVGTLRTVIILFEDAHHAQAVRITLYDDCRPAIDAWLTKHFQEHLADEGTGESDVECSGYAPDNDEVIDMRTTLTAF